MVAAPFAQPPVAFTVRPSATSSASSMAALPLSSTVAFTLRRGAPAASSFRPARAASCRLATRSIWREPLAPSRDVTSLDDACNVNALPVSGPAAGFSICPVRVTEGAAEVPPIFAESVALSHVATAPVRPPNTSDFATPASTARSSSPVAVATLPVADIVPAAAARSAFSISTTPSSPTSVDSTARMPPSASGW